MSDLPTGPYDLILADPPWKFSSNSRAKPGRNAMRHYDCMALADICALPVEDIAETSAVLYLWATVPMLDQAFDVMRAWGFRYVSNLTWRKSRIGTGFWVRNRHEHVLIGRRGKPRCPRPAHRDSIIESDQREHSRKPDELFHQIEEAYPTERKVELFARERRDGWDCWGDQVGKFEGAL
ncbi:MAG: MT-A70 family methyltransferase [Pseudomonadota bacterium]